MDLRRKIKEFLKSFIMLNYYPDGTFKIYFQFPIRFDAKRLYKAFYASYPIQKNKIVFDNYMGKGYGCNPKYVAEELLRRDPKKYDLVWVVSESDQIGSGLPPGIRCVTYGKPEAELEYATAKVWVSNYHKILNVRKGMFRKPEQSFIQMWHGSLGIKKIENDVQGLTVDPAWLKMAKASSGLVTHWISNSTFESEIYQRAFWDVENIQMLGHPRNDILLQDNTAVKAKVANYYRIEGKKILLYAPTFREDYRMDCYGIDYERLLSALAQRFGGEWVALVRLHPRVRKYSAQIMPHNAAVMDATYYTDIQELVAAADAMITDYSSCIFDFVLTRRPGFIYATDKEEYDTERGFYFPLESTPFPVATDNDSLIRSVQQFEETSYREKVEDFLREKGCVDDGHASERVADLIEKLVNA